MLRASTPLDKSVLHRSFLNKHISTPDFSLMVDWIHKHPNHYSRWLASHTFVLVSRACYLISSEFSKSGVGFFLLKSSFLNWSLCSYILLYPEKRNQVTRTTLCWKALQLNIQIHQGQAIFFSQQFGQVSCHFITNIVFQCPITFASETLWEAPSTFIFLSIFHSWW